MMSDDTARRIDAEVRVIVEGARDTAHELLAANREKLELMAEALMRYETIDQQQIDQIMDGKEPDPPEGWSDTEAGSSDVVGNEKSSRKDDRAPIGGPAEQH
jgi:cell division protease FtsH